MNDLTSEIEATNTPKLFEGDKGTINYNARRAIAHLFSGPVYCSKQPELWAAIINNREELESLANNLSVNLIVDINRQESYLQPINDPDYTIKPLRKLHLNFYDSILWVFLSEKLLASDSRGESANIEKHDIVTYLNRFESISNNDEKKHRDSINSAINKADLNGVITQLKSSFDVERYRINNLLSMLLNVDQVMILKDVLNEYKGESDGSKM